jgi:hypothetical protein
MKVRAWALRRMMVEQKAQMGWSLQPTLSLSPRILNERRLQGPVSWRQGRS